MGIKLRPAFRWRDLDDGATMLERIIEALKEEHFHSDDVEVEFDGDPDVTVFENGRLFSCSRALASGSGTLNYYKNSGVPGGISTPQGRNERNGDSWAEKIARAVLLSPYVSDLTISGNQMGLSRDMGADTARYIVSVLRTAVFDNANISVQYPDSMSGK
ncbi:MAG: hypothetical protein ACREJM_11305 [Candidatus Saccharimonadales bacterium]